MRKSVGKLPPIDVLRTVFPFGCYDVGTLFFHSENHSIWLIYGEMYMEPVANSFEGLMEKAVLDKKRDFDWRRCRMAVQKGCFICLEQPLNVFR